MSFGDAHVDHGEKDVSMHVLEVMAKTIYGEARGECYDGRVAVAHVILNRAQNPRWWGDGVVDVCLKAKQFSCWNDDDPNRDKLDELTVSDSVFMECCSVAALALGGVTKDPTDDADHYHTHSVAPFWSIGQTPTVEIGNHYFYRLEL